MMLLEQLRNTATDRVDESVLVGLLVAGRQILATYAEFDLEPPEWLSEKIDSLTKAIKEKRTDNLQHALRAAEARSEALKTAEQKRDDNTKLIESLKAKLAAK